MADEVGAPVVIRDMKTGGLSQLEMTNHMHGRRLIRTAKNPMDICTIVSIFPKEIDEEKITLEDGKFHIPAGSFENPGIFIVGGRSWWKDYDPDQPVLEIPVSSIQVANSIIQDYSNGMLGCNMSDAMPGLFFVLGKHTKLEIQMNCKEKLNEVKTKQDNWYRALVRLADSLWSRTNGNPLAIWEEMRLAARSLNLNDKPWLKDFQMAELVRCFACGNMRNPNFPICPTCKSIDANHPEAKNLKFAV
jgi:hypothetical protein